MQNRVYRIPYHTRRTIPLDIPHTVSLAIPGYVLSYLPENIPYLGGGYPIPWYTRGHTVHLPPPSSTQHHQKIRRELKASEDKRAFRSRRIFWPPRSCCLFSLSSTQHHQKIRRELKASEDKRRELKADAARERSERMRARINSRQHERAQYTKQLAFGIEDKLWKAAERRAAARNPAGVLADEELPVARETRGVGRDTVDLTVSEGFLRGEAVGIGEEWRRASCSAEGGARKKFAEFEKRLQKLFGVRDVGEVSYGDFQRFYGNQRLKIIGSMTRI